MRDHDQTEQAYKNGYCEGFQQGFTQAITFVRVLLSEKFNEIEQNLRKEQEKRERER